jgi:hypothetical protein
MPFGDLRSILQRPPDPLAWGALCDLLDRWPDVTSLRDVALPYALDHLASWPDALRAAPAHWLDRPDEPRLSLASTIWISAGGPLTDAHAISALHDAPLPSLRALRAAYTPLDHALIDAICAAPWIARIITLQLDHALLDDADAAQIAAAPLTALRSLELRHNLLSPRHVNALLDLPALEHLAIAGNKNMLQPAIREVRWRDHVKVTI